LQVRSTVSATSSGPCPDIQAKGGKGTFRSISTVAAQKSSESERKKGALGIVDRIEKHRALSEK